MTLVAVWRPSADQDLGAVLAEIPEEYKEQPNGLNDNRATSARTSSRAVLNNLSNLL